LPFPVPGMVNFPLNLNGMTRPGNLNGMFRWRLPLGLP
jgi:hypothetical protein